MSQQKSKLLTDIESPLVRETISFVYTTIQMKLDAFFDKNTPRMDLSTEEHKLEYTEIYKDYEALLEDHLNDFATSKGYDSPAAFIEALSKAASENERSDKLVQMILAAADYDKFAALLRIKAKLSHAKQLMEDDESEDEGKDQSDGDDSAFYQNGSGDDETGGEFKGEAKESDGHTAEESKGQAEAKDSHK
jgi:hypothetical protein